MGVRVRVRVRSYGSGLCGFRDKNGTARIYSHQIPELCTLWPEELKVQ